MRQLLASIAIAIAFWILPAASARADSVLYDNAGFLQGRESFVQSLDISTAGTLTVTLSNIPFLDTISDLSWFVSSATGVIDSFQGAGTDSFSIGPGTFFAHWSGNANGAAGLGVYGMKITFQANDITPVPLPGAWLLLLSGMFFLITGRRKTQFRMRMK